MTLASPIAFAGAPLDLAENDRNDAQLAAYSKAGNARAILVHDGRILVSGTGELAYVHPQALAGKHLPDPGPLFLGRDQGVPVFAFSIAREEEGTGLGEDFKFEILRALALNMPAHPLALAGRAKSLFDWHREHRFCANCGQESRSENGGLMRKCRSCATGHFPRVNPVVIMLVCNGDRCLMGRNAKWPDGTYSCLAGFVSAGETLEEACKREVLASNEGEHVHQDVPVESGAAARDRCLLPQGDKALTKCGISIKLPTKKHGGIPFGTGY